MTNPAVAAPDDDIAGRVVRRDLAVAWVVNAVACTYFGWQFWVIWRAGDTMKAMFEGLGTEVHPVTRIVIDQRSWLLPSIYSGLVAVVAGKEFVVRDKRLSTMITCLLTIV